jgi:transposase-like protein
MRRRSHFTPAQKRDEVLGVLTKRKTVSETCRELGISEQTLARWREQAVEGMELGVIGGEPEGGYRIVSLAREAAGSRRSSRSILS